MRGLTMPGTELIALAESACPLRREVATDAELMDAISPATPDRVSALDKARTVFLAEWRLVNEDARTVAEEDIASMRARANVVVLTGVVGFGDSGEYLGFYFALTFTLDEVIEESEADN